MHPQRLLHTTINQALIDLAGAGIKDSPEARRMLLAIALQESGLKHRRQVTSTGKEDGPAASFWQFERGGGCRGVLTHPAVAPKMKQACADHNIEATEAGLWEAMRFHDVIAATAARLLLYTLPSSLPTTAEQGWQ